MNNSLNKINSGQVSIAFYSRFAPKKKDGSPSLRLTKTQILAAFKGGADLILHSANGQMCHTACSSRDFAVGARIQVYHNGGFVNLIEITKEMIPN
jgi:hypothetical protein